MSTTPANWYPDPLRRHQLRYWDGQAWTDHVSDNGIQGTDPVAVPPPPVTSAGPTFGNNKVADQVVGLGMRGAGVDATHLPRGTGTFFGEPVLVVNQKAKLIEVTNQYAVYDRDGKQIGYVTEVGQSTAKKVLRVVSSLDQFMTHRLEARDMNNNVVLQLTRPRKVLKSTVIVADGAGNEIGRIVQENAIGKIHFGLEAGGNRLGEIRAENWRAWNFAIDDASGTEVARITKTFEGVMKTMFTSADNYVVQLHTAIPQPLLSLVVASALSVDTALKQDARGFG
ncbi:MAG: phospholipid scramblase-related protein [Acidimicrobiia bacterium]